MHAGSPPRGGPGWGSTHRRRPSAPTSSGQRRLIDLARATLRKPAVLLDEPLAGLDPATRAAVVSLLRAAAADGLTIVMAEHDRATVGALASATTELDRDDLVPVLEPAS